MKLFNRVIYLFLIVLWYGCASSPHPTPVLHPTDASYTSAYPTREISKQLIRIQKSVQRIISTVKYDVYRFSRKITRQMLQDSAHIALLASQTSTSKQSNAGTAVAILQNDRYTLFLTAYHIAASPDTVIFYKDRPGISENTYIGKAKIKKESNIYLIHAGLIFKTRLIAADRFNDLALLVAENEIFSFTVPPLSISTGTASNLQLGSLIYILGYPLGNPMVTMGMVSSPNYDQQGSFLTDALFNHGISGGLIIASNNRYQTFEWVGMASTTSVKRIQFLAPKPHPKFPYQPFELYNDSIYVDQMSSINYGVSNAVSIKTILEFIYDNEETLNSYGLSAANLRGQ